MKRYHVGDRSIVNDSTEAGSEKLVMSFKRTVLVPKRGHGVDDIELEGNHNE